MFNLAILRHNRLRPVSNYLFGIVFRVFPTRSRFHKFQYCSIFKVLRRPPCGQLIYYISSSFFCQALFWDFFEPPGLSAGSLSWRQPVYFTPSKIFCQDLFWSFFSSSFSNCSAGCPHPVRDSVAGPPRSGAIIIPCKVGTVKHFLSIFSRKYHFWRFLQFLHRYLNNLTVVLPAVYTGRNFGIPARFYSV